MRIGIDARLNAYRGGGIPQYTHQILTALANLIPADDTLVALQHVKQSARLVDAPTVQHTRMFTPPHHRFEAWSLPLEVLRLRLDVMHYPDFIAPRLSPCPTIVTIHDLAFMHYPEILDDDARRYYGQVRESVHRADAVIAVSEATRQDICELLEISPDRIDVVYEAAAAHFVPRIIPAGEYRTIGMGGSMPEHNGHVSLVQGGTFCLFVSTLEPRKNLSTLLRALRICHNRGKHYHLVVAGSRGWYDDVIFQDVRDLGLGDSVLFVGQVGNDDLVWLYNACVVYANPSLYEGFGLPVVEALACGAPSLVADTGSLPEVAGDAALLLPPRDAEAWADAIEHLWENPDERATLKARGPQQAARFSWERAARETLAIYRRVGKSYIPLG